MSDSEDHDLSPVVSSWAERIVNREDAIRGLLQEVSEAQLHNGEKAREIVQNFADGSGRGGLFSGVYFTLEGEEGFFNDVQDATDEETTEVLRDISADFSELEEEFRVAYREEFEGMVNPITNHESQVGHLWGEHGDPLISFRAYAGSERVVDTRVLPTKLLDLAARLSGSVEQELQLQGNEVQLSEPEIEGIIEECKHARRHLDKIEELVEDSQTDQEEEEANESQS